MRYGRYARLVFTAAVVAGLIVVTGCAPVTTPTAAVTSAATTAPTNTVAPATTSTAAPQATVGATKAATASAAATAVATTGTAAAATPAPVGTSVAGEGIVGHWEGAITISGQDLGIIIDFAATGGGYSGTMDIPAQAATDIPLGNITFQAPAVHFEAFSGSRLAVFEGQLVDPSAMSGSFTQAGYEGTFALARTAVATPSPVPYTQQDVTFSHDEVSLAGTLTLPEGSGPFPAVVLISGSGQQNRDEEIYGFKIFGVIADHLTRAGIAVLRYDDRGVGGSTGDVASATSEDFAADTLAAVNYLAGRPEISRLNIGLLGHSEGGVIAPMVANESDNVAFVILMAGPAIPGDQLLAQQLQTILKAQGASQEQIDAAVAQQQTLLQAIKTGQGWDVIGTSTATELRATVEALPTADRGSLGDVDTYVAQAAAAQVAAANTPWLQFFVSYDPAPALKALTVPVLALYGSKDVQVPVPANSDAARAAFAAGSNTDTTVEVLQDANHLFQKANTGSPDEYATLPKEFVLGFLDTITGWILERQQTAG